MTSKISSAKNFKRPYSPTHYSGILTASIMFVDIRDFGKLSEAQLVSFANGVLPALARIIAKHKASFIDRNTWGDGLVVVSSDPVVLARMALEIRNYYRTTNFEALGLPVSLESRIALHAGSVRIGRDPIRGRDGAIGINLTYGARLEPVVVPGDVWITEAFFRLIEPYLTAERLAIDDLGIKQLAKGFGSFAIKRLRNTFEPKRIDDRVTDEMRNLLAHSSVRKSYDVVGIGALNCDYIATRSTLTRIARDTVSENESYFEVGRERKASMEDIDEVMAKIGVGSLSFYLGGSAFNTLHALSRALPELKLAFVGVAGRTRHSERFIETLETLGISTELVEDSTMDAGICVSYITRGERSLLTSPGANLQMSAHLYRNREAIIALIGRSRIVHITSLFDSESPIILAEILREAKDRNPWLQVSFDPGYEWVRSLKRENVAEKLAILDILSLASYLFVNNSEFEELSSNLEVQPDLEKAEKIFEKLSPQAVIILLKRYDEVRIFHRLHRKVKEIPYTHEAMGSSQIEDATGAGDVFAAGMFSAIGIPGLELADGVELGLRFAKLKLSSSGTSEFRRFGRVIEDYVDDVYASSKQ